jgi:hypothetical protein
MRLVRKCVEVRLLAAFARQYALKPDEVASVRILIQLYYFVRAAFFGKSVTLFRVDVLDLTIRLRLPGEALENDLVNYRLRKRSHTLIAGIIVCNLGFHIVPFNFQRSDTAREQL